MKKQVRKILSVLLVLTMLLSTLPAAVYAEAGDVEPIATPTVEPIEEPIVETIATPVPEATEEPTEEPIIEVTAEPAGEPAAEPVVEPAEEPAAMPAAPAELTDAQQAALNALPAGFSAQAVAAAMLSSNNCAHTVFHIQVTWAEEAYTRIDDENHRYTGKITQKKLVCGNCGATLQTISANEVYDEVYGHDWVMDIDSTSPYDFVCSSCGAKKRFTSACSHTNVYQGEDGNLHCKDCGAITYVFEKNECEHKNITIIQPDTVLTWYDQWDAKTHVKYTATWHYDDATYVDAECDDCGISIICDRNGNNRSYGTTDTAGSYTNEKSAMEAHSFENGVCAQCGYKQSETDPDTCDHSAGNYNDVLDTDIAPVYSNITAESHCVQYSYKRYCKDCNAYIGNVTDEGITPVPHDFGTGDTCACGYKKAETPEDAPYVRGFTMSASEIQVGQDVTFTLDIANAKAGDVLTLEFCADSGKYKEEFTLTYPDNVFTHEFSQDGNRSICFRVVGGEYCAAQTLIVEASKAGIDSAKLSISNLSVVEKAEGETIRATVICNNQTGVAELYVGSAKNYASSDDYDVVDGRRVFEVEVTLGGNGKSYAGDYKIWVNALKGAYQAVDATYNLGTLKVTHVYTTQSEPAGSYYEKSANGHTLYNKTKITETCSVCGDHKETTQKKPAGSEEPHVGLTENGKCSVCGYRGNIFTTANSGKDFSVPASKLQDSFVIKAEKEQWSEVGKIRYVEQWNYNYDGKVGFGGRTYESYWGNDLAVWGKLNGVQQTPTNLCTRAAASMALSYMGKNVLPKNMTNEFEGGNYYKTAAAKAGCSTEGRGNNGKEKITSELFIKWYNDYAMNAEGKYSPVSIRVKKTKKQHAFTIIGRDSTNPNCFYIADPGNGMVTTKIYLTDVDGELRVEAYMVNEAGKKSVQYNSSLKVLDMWRYISQD